MGIDMVDLLFRLEKAFNIRLDNWDTAHLFEPQDKVFVSPEELRYFNPTITAVTVGEIHLRLCELLKRDGHPIPADSWQRVQRCVSQCLAIPIERVLPEARIVQDLGAT